jgi:hypothetical protein
VSKLARHVRLLPGSSLDDLALELEGLEKTQPAETAESDDAHLTVPVRPAEGTAALLAECHDLAERLSDAVTLQYFSHVYDTQHATMNA